MTIEQATREIDRLNQQVEKQAKTISEQRGLYHEMTNTISRLKEQLALPKPMELQEKDSQIERLCEQFSEVVSDRIDPLGNVNWMRCSPDLPKYVKELEDRITELEIQEAGWFRAASMLRVGMGLADGSDLRECLLTFNQLRDKLDHAGKCNNAE